MTSLFASKASRAALVASALFGLACGAPDAAPPAASIDPPTTSVDPVSATPLVAGRYALRGIDSGKCLDVPASSLADGTHLQQYTCNGTGAQLFDVTVDATGYHLRNVTSGKMLDAPGGDAANGTYLQQWTDLGNTHQVFSIAGNSNGSYTLRLAGTSQAVDVAGWSKDDGGAVQFWGATGGANQQWAFVAAPSGADAGAGGPGAAPSDSGAAGSPTAARKAEILSYLRGISGQGTLVGIENKNTGTPTSDTDTITGITGKVSSFWGADFGFGSGAVGSRPTMIAEAKRQYAKGALVGLMYHACAPTRDEYCTWDDIGAANHAQLTVAQFTELVTPGTSLYQGWIDRLDTLAGFFQDLKDAGVVVLFRPLHEMNQCVFWWSCHAGPNGSARLYQITHDYLTSTKGLDNIIWVWNVQDFTTLASDVSTYSPGDSFFDVAALDVYNTGYTSSNYNAMLGAAAGKPIAIAECQFMPTSSLLASQNKWVYAMLWPDFIDANRGSLAALYGAGNVLTLDEMPGW